MGSRVGVRRELFEAEGELGWLGWEQVDFFDNEVNLQVAKVKEFEQTQASLQNTTAEISGRKAALSEELGREKETHDQTQASLAAERAPITERFGRIDSNHKLKLAAIERFEAALEEMNTLEKRLEAKSTGFMKVQNPDFQTRIEARDTSDELGRIALERKMLIADRLNAANAAAAMEPDLEEIRRDLQRIDTAAAAARQTLDAARRRVADEVRLLEGEHKKTTMKMAHLDREKQQPYRLIGVCLADHNIAPLNQPHLLDNVLNLRERERQLTDTIGELHAACAAASLGTIVGFYLILAILLLGLVVLAVHIR
jgi:chromosome segregation ATPase